jgi:tRNA 2-selenouridine synthase
VIIADHRRILRDGLPLIDLRSPAEFAQGAFPHAINLPLLTDPERAAIGTCYKANGQHAAIELGETLVAGAVRRARVDAWLAFIGAHPNAVLYCWRGGLRSQIVQEWLRRKGLAVARIDGGYKALRRTCLEVIDQVCAASWPRLIVLGGRTGSGKTELLNEFVAAIDLERLANHRGSAFGATFTPQPTPIGFENALAIELLPHLQQPHVLLEDESRTIGRLALPANLHATMQTAPLIVLDVPREERARRIYHEYVHVPLSRGVSGAQLHARFTDAVDRIKRRLGGARQTAMRGALDAAFASAGADPAVHYAWIESLLEWYYDPMYDHQLALKRSRIVIEGDRALVRAYLHTTLD